MKDLVRIFNKNGIKLQKNQEILFENYFSSLIETNKKFNLTAITDEKEVVLKHFLDSVLPMDFIPKNCSVVDVGSGAGFPAIPLKIMRDDLKMCMVDGLNKRVNFLNEVVNNLKLSDAVAVHARIEDFAQNNRENFDVAVARAVAPLNTLVEYMLPLVKVGGIAVIYKSTKLEEELAEAQKAIKILGGKVDKVVDFEIADEEKLQRKILVVKKIAVTPSKYPRGQNKPKQSPIR